MQSKVVVPIVGTAQWGRYVLFYAAICIFSDLNDLNEDPSGYNSYHNG